MEQKRTVLLTILQFIFFVIGGLFLSQFLAVLALLPLHDFDLLALLNKINDPIGHPEMKMQMLTLQGISSFVAFVFTPMFFIIWKERYWRAFLYTNTQNKYLLIFYAVVLVLVSLPFVSYMVSWNESVNLPESLSWFETWAKEKEEFLKKVTESLTRLNTPFELIIGLVVIALLPALGEELVFRGYLQNKFAQLFGSYHIAIWLSAFLFSAIHFQFYGFVPRMVLGGIFGYLYFFTGQFHLPVVAHFTNNGLMIIMMYLKNMKYISYDIETEENISFGAASMSVLLMFSVLFLIMRLVKTAEPKK